MKTIAIILLAGFALLSSGCYSQKVAKRFEEFQKLGITEAEITGKFSHTKYNVEEKDGKRRAEFTHSNAWVPQVRFVRETPKEEPTE